MKFLTAVLNAFGYRTKRQRFQTLRRSIAAKDAWRRRKEAAERAVS